MTQAFNLSQLANNLNTAGQLDATDGLVNAVPVANGGTGASTDSAARTNLNVPTRTGGDASGTWGINVTGNATSASAVTNGVYTIGDQTINGTKTFTNGVRFNDGTTQSTAAAGGIRSQVFTGSGTFTIPTGVTALKVTVIGAGGGGGGAEQVYGPGIGGTGGAAGYALTFLAGLTSGNTISVTVGAGGTGGPAVISGNGGAGGTTSISSGTQSITTTSVLGGGGGIYTFGGVDLGINGANGATPTGGTINVPGATIVYGATPAIAAPNTNGSPGLSHQAGGGGGYANNSVRRAGGAGAPGLVIFEW
jgi:hypothetical protein